jgi:hypothetical protein
VPINRNKRALFPIILQRQSLADALQRHLQAAGLSRVARPVETLDALRRRIAVAATPAPPVEADTP